MVISEEEIELMDDWDTAGLWELPDADETKESKQMSVWEQEVYLTSFRDIVSNNSYLQGFADITIEQAIRKLESAKEHWVLADKTIAELADKTEDGRHYVTLDEIDYELILAVYYSDNGVESCFGIYAVLPGEEACDLAKQVEIYEASAGPRITASSKENIISALYDWAVALKESK